MDEKRDMFLFYRSWLENIEELYDDEETQKNLIFSICKYGIKGEKTFPTEKLFLMQCYSQIDSAQDKHMKRAEAGRKGGQNSKGGGAPEGNTNAQKNNKQTTSKQQANINIHSHIQKNESEYLKENNNVFPSDVVFLEKTSSENSEKAWEEQFDE